MKYAALSTNLPVLDPAAVEQAIVGQVSAVCRYKAQLERTAIKSGNPVDKQAAIDIGAALADIAGGLMDLAYDLHVIANNPNH